HGYRGNGTNHKKAIIFGHDITPLFGFSSQSGFQYVLELIGHCKERFQGLLRHEERIFYESPPHTQQPWY
ncbi:hypothetical protein RXO98_28095, partial [Pseudomonas aeruginosa]|nr:hypothetical protein [Pseudomonas aeruginosa]